MKLLPLMMTVLMTSVWLPSCSSQQDEQHDAPMLRLQLLLAQAANLAVLPGTSARQQALQLARRAMSGPEMNAMHHGAGADQPTMQRTHDLGDAVFELLDVRSEVVAFDALQSYQTKLIQVAAQAAQMRLTGVLLGEDTGAFMHSKGQNPSPYTVTAHDAYDKAAAHLLAMLNQLEAPQTGIAPLDSSAADQGHNGMMQHQ